MSGLYADAQRSGAIAAGTMGSWAPTPSALRGRSPTKPEEAPTRTR